MGLTSGKKEMKKEKIDTCASCGKIYPVYIFKDKLCPQCLAKKILRVNDDMNNLIKKIGDIRWNENASTVGK